MIAPSCGRFHSGIASISGSELMITAQACTPALRTRPSSRGGLVDGPHVGIGVDQRPDLGGLLVPLVVGVGDAPTADVLAMIAGGSAW